MKKGTQWLNLADHKLAYQQRRSSFSTNFYKAIARFFPRLTQGKRPQKRPGVIFLGGYGSDMTGTKARFLDSRCHKAGYDFLRFDYRGHGLSSDTLRNGTIGAWIEDALTVFDQLTTGPQILVGSSMGGWIAFALALARPERVAGIVGVAAAPDFTKNLVWPFLDDAQKETLIKEGEIEVEGLPLTLRLIEEGREHLVFDRLGTVHIPVHLLQGQADKEVPWQYATQIAERLGGADVRVSLVKDADHRFSREQDLEALWSAVRTAVEAGN